VGFVVRRAVLRRTFGGFLPLLEFDGAVFGAAAEGNAQRNFLGRTSAVGFDFGSCGGRCGSGSWRGYRRGSGCGLERAEVRHFPYGLLV
jgi:hypothetical protein